MARFKTRARTVDMLGRQQIASVPTAINELFKNAHDAYADRVEVDYFLSDNLFILGDDGFGMTREEFDNRWLTLATETRLSERKQPTFDPHDFKKKPRPIMGEKGIGRLAIAAIGPQVLVLTRALRKDGLHDLIAAFINWSIFESPGINLDQIEIPIRKFKAGTLPDAKSVSKMVAKVKQNVLELKADIPEDLYSRINVELNQFIVDPKKFADFLSQPNLTDDKGTQFYILPATENLKAEIEIDLKGQSVSKLTKLLLGFEDILSPNAPKPRIKTAFRYWENNEQSHDIIADYQFFTPDDFYEADHRFIGRFNEYGQFKGTVSIYGEEFQDHIVNWHSGKKLSACGPFSTNIAYVQGRISETKMIPDEFYRLSNKLDRFSGLYIYKDGIRILPYGDSEYDFLLMEERRSKGAGYYFFSYRRIFGTIKITQEHNSNLVEKAGREGFQENIAYREFKDILTNFFVQITADFFREGGGKVETFERWKQYLARLKEAREKHGEQTRAARKLFQDDLESFFSKVEANQPQKDCEQILDDLRNKLQEAFKPKDTDTIMSDVVEAEANAIIRLSQIRNEYRIQKPIGVGLTTQLNRDWKSHMGELERLYLEYFSPTERLIGEIVTTASNEAQLHIERRHRVNRLVNEISTVSRKTLSDEIDRVKEAAENAQERVIELTKILLKQMDNTIDQIEGEINEINLDKMSEDEIATFRTKLEKRLTDETDDYKSIFQQVLTQLANVQWETDKSGIPKLGGDWTGALEDEVLALRERSQSDLQLTQLGMAIEIINHEFESATRSIRSNLQNMKNWADINPDFRNLYRDIRANFEHLDGYLTLFTPLHRRLYRTEVSISGADIAKFIDDLFGERMKRHHINFKATPSFREKVVRGYPSTFYPVFINLVDNAIYWLGNIRESRNIRFDAKDNALLISNNGPEIPRRDRESIFERGFTRKPGGAGLGLYISRMVLNRDGYQLELDLSEPNGGTTFKISPR
jgi:hypothetical protein